MKEKEITIKGTSPNWDTKTADRCRLPELIPNICEGCRDYRYCHRQLTIEEQYMQEKEELISRQAAIYWIKGDQQ